ncbi:hypothetical protein TI03_04685, partial [Achromatium sp. WMS1]
PAGNIRHRVSSQLLPLLLLICINLLIACFWAIFCCCFNLLTAWEQALELLVAVEFKATNAVVNTIREDSDARLRQLNKRLLNTGHTITPKSSSEQFHELRKLGKKLRYLLEFYQELYDPKLANQVIKKTKKLLDSLGIYQDSTVQLKILQDISDQQVLLLQNGNTQAFFKKLVNKLKQQQKIAQKQAINKFIQISNNKGQDLFKAMLQSTPSISILTTN